MKKKTTTKFHFQKQNKKRERKRRNKFIIYSSVSLLKMQLYCNNYLFSVCMCSIYK